MGPNRARPSDTPTRAPALSGSIARPRRSRRPNLRGEVALPRLALERCLQMMALYENWPTALADRLGLLRRRPRHVLYRIRKRAGAAQLVARTNSSDVRTIGEIWIGSLYDRFFGATSLRGRRPVIIDIGANCGYFAVFIATRYPGARIVCFEPEAENRGLATVNLALNSVKAEVRAEAVLAGSCASVVLNLSEDPRLHTTVPPEDAADYGLDGVRYSGRSTEVPALHVNDAIEAIAATEWIDLLKIDVEGVDLDLVTALSDANLSRIHYIVAETEGRSTDRTVEHLERNFFSVFEDAHLLFACRRLPSSTQAP